MVCCEGVVEEEVKKDDCGLSDASGGLSVTKTGFNNTPVHLKPVS